MRAIRSRRPDAQVFLTEGAIVNGEADLNRPQRNNPPSIRLTAYATGGSISGVYRNGVGTFAYTGAGLPGVRYSLVTRADHDNDGDLDILLAGSTSSSVRTIAAKAFTASQGNVVGFCSVTPCRALDSRGAAYGPALSAGETTEAPIGRVCGAPTGARSVSFNVTIVAPTHPGDLRIFPAEGGLPLVQPSNYSPGQRRATTRPLPSVVGEARGLL